MAEYKGTLKTSDGTILYPATTIDKVINLQTELDKIGEIRIDNAPGGVLPTASSDYLNQIYKLNNKYYHVALVYDEEVKDYSLASITTTTQVTPSTYESKIGEKISNDFNIDWKLSYDDTSSISYIYGDTGCIKFGTQSDPGLLEWSPRSAQTYKYITEISFNVTPYSTSYDGYFSLNIYDSSEQYVYETYDLPAGEVKNVVVKNLRMPITTGLVMQLSSSSLTSNAVKFNIKLNSFSFTILNGSSQVYRWVDITSQVTAEDVSYDNEESGLTSTNVQDAITEVYNKSVEVSVSGTVLEITTR